MRGFLKAILPSAVRTILRLPKTYLGRLAVWRSVLFHMRGETKRDRRVLFRSARAGSLASLRHPNEWQDPVLIESANITVADVGRFAVRPFCDDLYHVLPTREPEVLAAICEILREGDIFIDAGANIGFYSVVGANQVGRTGRVLAVEMMPDTVERLRITLDMNGVADRVSVLPFALSERSGQEVVASVTSGKFGQASIISEPGQSARRIPVYSRALDDLSESETDIRLIKLDLEGGELGALKGARKTLERTTAVIFEQLGRGGDIGSFFEASGFTVRMLDPNNWIAERDPRCLIGSRDDAQ